MSPISGTGMEGGRGQASLLGRSPDREGPEKAEAVLSLNGVAEEKRKSGGLVEGQDPRGK